MMTNKKYDTIVEGFALREPYPADLGYDRTEVLFPRVIAEVPALDDPRLTEEDILLLHRRQIAKKNIDLHNVHAKASSATRTAYARDVCEAWISYQLVQDLMDRVRRYAKTDAEGHATVLLMPNVKTSFIKDINILTYAYAAVLCEFLQDAADKANLDVDFAVSLNLQLPEYGGSRTMCDALGRLARQSVQVSLEKLGANVILVDDHAETCTTFAVGYQAIIAAGGNLLAISALSGMPDAANIRVHPVIRDALAELACDTDKLNAALAPAGMLLDTLTNREALLVYAFLSPAATLAEAPEFRRLLEAVNYDFTVKEGQNGSIWEALAMPAMTLDELACRIYDEATQGHINILQPGQVLAYRPPVTADELMGDLATGSRKYFVKAPSFVSFDT